MLNNNNKYEWFNPFIQRMDTNKIIIIYFSSIWAIGINLWYFSLMILLCYLF